MRAIDQIYGPFDEDEVAFYIEQLDGGMNSFQKELVFNLFYKYFGDPVSIKAINIADYAKLIIASRTILQGHSMIILPYVLSGNIKRLVSRKSLNKKEELKLMSSPFYQQLKLKYRNEETEKYILSLIATVLSSEIDIVDFYEDDLHGKSLEIMPDIILEEILMYINLI